MTSEHRHALDFEYMSDSPDETPIAAKVYCRSCRQEWLFDGSIKDDLMPLEAQLTAARADASDLAEALTNQCPSHMTASSSTPDEQGRLHHFGIDNDHGYAHWLPCTLTSQAETALANHAKLVEETK